MQGMRRSPPSFATEATTMAGEPMAAAALARVCERFVVSAYTKTQKP